MVIGTKPEALEGLRASRRIAGLAGVLVMASTMGLVPSRGTADSLDEEGKHCTATAKAVHTACRKGAESDYWIAFAICINMSDEEERAECFADAKVSRRDGDQFCREQRDGRREACESLGEDRYDPEIDPASFDTDFVHPTNPNPYYPLVIGYRWELRGGPEVNILDVVNETKLIDGLTCIVVRDQVFKDGDLVENTDDWFAQNKNGDVHYLGEEVKDFESFEGDDPRRPELVSISGSFKSGREGDKGGVIFYASPAKGQTYTEEFSLGNAEDVTEILSTTYRFGSEPDLDRFVPRELAEILCPGNCVVTKNWSLLEPGIFAYKYYAREIGFFLEVNPDTGELVQLVNCNFDSRCGILPAP